MGEDERFDRVMAQNNLSNLRFRLKLINASIKLIRKDDDERVPETLERLRDQAQLVNRAIKLKRQEEGWEKPTRRMVGVKPASLTAKIGGK